MEAVYCLVREVERHLHPAEQTGPDQAAPMDQLLLLVALTPHLIASRTGTSDLAPFEQARKDAAMARRREAALLSHAKKKSPPGYS